MSDPVISTLVNAFLLLVPEGVLGVAACVLFLGGTFQASRRVWGTVALLALATSAIAWKLVPLPASGGSEVGIDATTLYASPILIDPLASLMRGVALVGGAVLILLSWNEVPDRQAAEYHGCVLLAVAGLCLTGSANELVTLFVALELISIPTYILLYLPRHDHAAQEAAMKYFLLSVFSSALLLFGFSYLYGLAGTTNLPALVEALGSEEPSHLPGVALVALVMVAAGLGFRMTAVPFHYYAPDVYQGAPTGGAAFLAFLPKVAGFTALLRVLGLVWSGHGTGGPALGDQAPILFWILAAVTMTLGNVLALLQSNLKRLLAYSSVAHAGYMLIGVAVASSPSSSGPTAQVSGGVEAVLFYLVAYGGMTVGAFAVLAYLSTPEHPVETEDDLAGLSQSHPGVAFLMAIFLFSLIGIPLTAGFVGKFLLFWGAVAQGTQAPLFRWLALIGAVNAAIGAAYYLRILARMYLGTSLKPVKRPRELPGLAALWICAAVTLILGIFPDLLLQEASRVTYPQSAPPALQSTARPAPQ
jgi:NADH-quinone oxidoreductase subunit N